MSKSARSSSSSPNNGVPHFTEAGLQDALTRVTKSGKLVAAHEFDKNASCDTCIIPVGTPLSTDGKVRVDMIEAATHELAANMRDGALVILQARHNFHPPRRGDRP